MATGDQADMVGRLRATLPSRWFANTQTGAATNTPYLDGILNGLAWGWAWFFSLFAYANLQSRIATATDIFLDIIALDFFAGRTARKQGELDTPFSARIQREIIRPRATRASITRALTDLTGRVPVVFEPANATDTGGIGFTGMTAGTGLGIGLAGGVGSLALPFQGFVTAYRAVGGGIPGVMGVYTGTGWAGGGIGVGAIEIASLSMSLGQITDADIYTAVASVLPAATICWTKIIN